MADKIILLEKLSQYGVKIVTGAKILEFLAGGAAIHRADGKEEVIMADTCISAFGTRPNNKIAEDIFFKNKNVKVIGDCVEIGIVGNAARDGFYAALCD